MYKNKLLLISLLKFLENIFNGLANKLDSIGLICQCVTPFVCQCNSIDFCAVMAVIFVLLWQSKNEITRC